MSEGYQGVQDQEDLLLAVEEEEEGEEEEEEEEEEGFQDQCLELPTLSGTYSSYPLVPGLQLHFSAMPYSHPTTKRGNHLIIASTLKMYDIVGGWEGACLERIVIDKSRVHT